MTAHGKIINVTQDHIDRGIRGHSGKCAIAQAIAQQIPDARNIDVDVQTIRFTDKNGDRNIFLTPRRAIEYIVAFDAGDPLMPFKCPLRSDGRVPARQYNTTPAGQEIRRAKDKLRRKTQVALDLAGDPNVSLEDRAKAQRAIEEADAELVKVREHYRGTPQVKNRSTSGRRPPPRSGGRSKQRTYGHRALRINQPVS